MSKGYLCYREDLEGVYRDAFDRAIMYAQCNNMEGAAADKMLENLLDSLMEAQRDGAPVTRIVGKDMEAFCKVYFEEYGWKERFLSWIETWFGVCIALFVIAVGGLIIDAVPTAEVQNAKMNIAPYLVVVGVAIAIKIVGRLVAGKVIFRIKKVSATVYSSVLFVSMCILLYVTMEILQDVLVYYVPVSWVLAVTGGWIAIGCIFLWRKKSGGGKDRRGGMADSRKNRELVYEGWKNRFARINKRRLRKGREQMTEIEFTEVLRKDYELGRKLDVNGF